MANPRQGFISAGCWCVDHNKTVPFWPQEDMAVSVTSLVRSGGGSACNFGINMRCLDADMPVETIGLVGDDFDGQFLREQAHRHGVGHERMQVTGAAPTMFTEAFQSLASGRRTHIVNAGVADLLSPDHFDFSGMNGRILHLGLPGLHAVMDAPWQDQANGWVAVLRKARAVGLETNLELVGATPERLREIVLPCLPYLDTLVVNDYEIGALARLPTVQQGGTDPQACLQAASKVLALGSMQFVVVHFVAGAVLLTRDGQALFKASVNVPEGAFRGANGAGDAFASGFMYGWHQGWQHEHSLTLAHAAAAAAICSEMTSGATGSVAECLVQANAWGWRTGGAE